MPDKSEIIDIAPFLAAIAVQIISTFVQLMVAHNLRNYHASSGTPSTLESLPGNIYSRFILDSDFLTAVASEISFIVSVVVTYLAKDIANYWVLIAYVSLGLLALAVSVIIYWHYGSCVGIYRARAICKGKISLLALVIVGINFLGMIGFISIR